MQRQLRLGDILDDYCPRERRLTNHAIVAMIGEDVKQTRCTTCDAEHAYKHARVPRQRKKDTPAGLAAQIIASAPKRISPERPALPSEALDDREATRPLAEGEAAEGAAVDIESEVTAVRAALGLSDDPRVEGDRALQLADDGEDGRGNLASHEPEGPAHRRLIRATLPRLDGQPPATRPAPEFTIRTPTGGRPNRFRARNQNPRGTGGAPPFGASRPGQPGNTARGGAQRNGNNRPPQTNQSRRFDGRKRSK